MNVESARTGNRDGRRSEQGFTLLEVTVIVVLLTILVVPLATAVVQLLHIVPESSQRTYAAVQRDEYLLRFSDDIAQSQYLFFDDFRTPANGTRTVTCPSAPADADYLLRFKWQDGGGTTGPMQFQYYRLHYRHGPKGTTIVELERTHGVDDFDTGPDSTTLGHEQVLRGYCVPGSELAATTVVPGSEDEGITHPRVTMAITLADTPGSAARTVTFEGVPRINDCCTNYSPLIKDGSFFAAMQFVPYDLTSINVSARPPYTLSATGLPPGLSMDIDGRVHGTATTSGTYEVQVMLEDGTGRRARRTLSFLVRPYPMPSITTTSLPAAVRDVVYDAVLERAGGLGGATWTASGLPPGITLDPTSGVLNGAATAAGTFAVDVTVTDAWSINATTSLTLVVHPPIAVDDPGSVNSAIVGSPYPETAFTATGGSGRYLWSAFALPEGMTIDAATGMLSGTPTAPIAWPRTHNVVIYARDATIPSAVGSLPLQLLVYPAVSITGPATLPAGTERQAYPTTTIVASGGRSGAYTWSATGLRAGMSIDPSTGQISGRPTVPGTYTVSVTVHDATEPNARAARDYSIVIEPRR